MTRIHRRTVQKDTTQWYQRNKRKKEFQFSPIKERNGMDLTEAEDIKKRWQEYTEELYKIFMNQIIPMV